MEFADLQVNRKVSIPVARLLDRLTDELHLEVIGGFQGIGRPVLISDINRPGLALSGYLEYFANDRLQVLGNTEIHYMEQLSPWELQVRLENILAFEIPAFVMSRNLPPSNMLLDMCNRRGIPILRSKRTTDEVISAIILFLAEEFAPYTTAHATAVDCFGVGCLIIGAPGIGKSETALELVERGHRIIADDMTILRRRREDALYAEASPVIEQHMEIRGVGIIDIRSVFGVGRVRSAKRIGLVIKLEEWDPGADYDRTGLKEEFVTIMGVRIPYLLIPVRPGRNLAIIVEVAALNHRLKEVGINPAEQLNKRLMSLMENE